MQSQSSCFELRLYSIRLYQNAVEGTSQARAALDCSPRSSLPLLDRRPGVWQGHWTESKVGHATQVPVIAVDRKCCEVQDETRIEASSRGRIGLSNHISRTES
jgi:hypothetical protein